MTVSRLNSPWKSTRTVCLQSSSATTWLATSMSNCWVPGTSRYQESGFNEAPPDATLISHWICECYAWIRPASLMRGAKFVDSLPIQLRCEATPILLSSCDGTVMRFDYPTITALTEKIVQSLEDLWCVEYVLCLWLRNWILVGGLDAIYSKSSEINLVSTKIDYIIWNINEYI